MTRTQIQNKIDEIKQMPQYDGTLSFITAELTNHLLSENISETNREKILADIESYVI